VQRTPDDLGLLLVERACKPPRIVRNKLRTTLTGERSSCVTIKQNLDFNSSGGERLVSHRIFDARLPWLAIAERNARHLP